MFPQECTAAIRACKAVADLPGDGHHVLPVRGDPRPGPDNVGESPAEVAKSLVAAGADVVGMNCGRGPDRAIVIIREMRGATDAPLVAYPNAGPAGHHGRHASRTSSGRRRWRASIRRSSTPDATSWARAAGRTPSTSAASRRSSEADARSGERAAFHGAARSHRASRSPSTRPRCSASRATRNRPTFRPRGACALRRGARAGA